MTSSTLLHATAHRLWWSLVDATESQARLPAVGQRELKLCSTCSPTCVEQHPWGTSIGPQQAWQRDPHFLEPGDEPRCFKTAQLMAGLLWPVII